MVKRAGRKDVGKQRPGRCHEVPRGHRQMVQHVGWDEVRHAGGTVWLKRGSHSRPLSLTLANLYYISEVMVAGPFLTGITPMEQEKYGMLVPTTHRAF